MSAPSGASGAPIDACNPFAARDLAAECGAVGTTRGHDVSVWTVVFVPKGSSVKLPRLSWFDPRPLDPYADRLQGIFPVEEVDRRREGRWFEGVPDPLPLAVEGRSRLRVGHHTYALHLPPELVDEFGEFLADVASQTPSRWVGLALWTGSTPVSVERDWSLLQDLIAAAKQRSDAAVEDRLYRLRLP